MKSPLRYFLANLDFSIDIIFRGTDAQEKNASDIRFFRQHLLKFNGVYFFEKNFKNRRSFRLRFFEFNTMSKDIKIKKTTSIYIYEIGNQMFEDGYIVFKRNGK